MIYCVILVMDEVFYKEWGEKKQINETTFSDHFAIIINQTFLLNEYQNEAFLLFFPLIHHIHMSAFSVHHKYDMWTYAF